MAARNSLRHSDGRLFMDRCAIVSLTSGINAPLLMDFPCLSAYVIGGLLVCFGKIFGSIPRLVYISRWDSSCKSFCSFNFFYSLCLSFGLSWFYLKVIHCTTKTIKKYLVMRKSVFRLSREVAIHFIVRSDCSPESVVYLFIKVFFNLKM